MSGLVLRDDEFAQLRSLLASVAGLVFDETRRSSMAFGVAERLRATGAPSVRDYLPLLGSADERQRLVDEVTIQETYFFRNPPQVRALREHVLPELLREAQQAGRRRLRIWSAGCSTGEEPYTVAMLLRELIPDWAGWDISVLATDVSSRAIAAARTARYGARAVQLATPEHLARFFAPLPDGSYEVRPEVRSLVRLRHHNLATDAPPFAPGDVDLVLCRNVTIYFDRDTTRSLMQRFHGALRDGGYLVLGHAETLWRVSEQFRLAQLGTGDGAAFFYRRLDPPREPRSVLPDRRTLDDGPPILSPERRVASRREPSDPGDRVRAALGTGAYEQALDLATQALEQAPLRADLHYLRGRAGIQLNRDALALTDLRKAVYLDPEDGFAHFLLAGVLSRLGDASAARREYAAAATTLRSSSGFAHAQELGGRDVGELVRLCSHLAAAPLRRSTDKRP